MKDGERMKRKKMKDGEKVNEGMERGLREG